MQLFLSEERIPPLCTKFVKATLLVDQVVTTGLVDHMTYDTEARIPFDLLEIRLGYGKEPVSYTHLRAHETVLDLVCRILLEKKKKNNIPSKQ